MKKTYILEELDCAHCAGKIEEAVAALSAVDSCSLNFLTKKLVIEAADADFAAITKEVKKIVKKIEPDVDVIEK